MKRFRQFVLILLATVLLAALFSCGGENESSSDTAESHNPADTTTTPATGDTTTAGETTNNPTTTTTEAAVTTTLPDTTALYPYDEYDLDAYMQYYWEGNTVYNESVMFVGKDDRASLMYTPDKIISVRSPDLKTEYTQGVDYLIKDGKLVLTENTSIPYMEKTEYYPSAPHPQGSFGCTVPGYSYIRWQEGAYFHSFQVAVTYTHSGTWEGYIPEGQSEKYPKTLEKLEKGEALKVLFYGDSITEGYNASGFVNAAPYADTWSKLVTEYLGKMYSNTKIEYLNTGVAGKDSAWAIQNLNTRVIDLTPDLVVLAFGMNDGGLTATLQTQRMMSIITQIKKKLPDTEILLVSTMLPNSEVAGFWGNQHSFEAMYITEAAAKHPDVAVVRMTSLHSALLENKAYYHMTGNNVNHPNDFLCRAYAQAIIKTLTGESES